MKDWKRRLITVLMAVIVTFLCTGISCAEEYNYKLKDVYNAKRISHFKKVIRYYNPSLDEQTGDRIARAIIYYSHKNKLEDDRMVAAVVAVESMFRPYAVSSSGAQGLGQLMPGTARGMSINNSFNIENNIWGTTLYLKRQLNRFSNQPRQRRYELALAAYNAGPGAVVRFNGVPPYRQTQEYVVKVINIWRQLSGLPKFTSKEMSAMRKRVGEQNNNPKVKVEIKSYYKK